MAWTRERQNLQSEEREVLRKINTIFIFEPLARKNGSPVVAREQYNVKIVGENTENDVWVFFFFFFFWVFSYILLEILK